MKYLIKILKKIGCLKYFNLKIVQSINDKTFKIPLLGNLGYAHLHDFEPWMQELLQIILPTKQGLFIDVGSNIGQVLLKLKSIDTERPYLGLEPNSNCVYYINKLIADNNLCNTTIIPVGLSTNTKVAQLSFYDHTDDDSCATIIKDFKNYKDVVAHKNVVLMNAEDALSHLVIEDISILKIDVEGAESLVIKSLQTKIEKHRPIIIVEILPVDDNDSLQHWEYQKNTVTLLENLGYKMYKIIHDTGLKGLKPVLDYTVDNDKDLYDYLFVPPSLTKHISKYNYEL